MRSRSSRSQPAWVGAIACICLTAGCATVHDRGQTLVPTRTLTQIGPYRIWTHEPLPSAAPVIQDLGDLERDLQAQLATRNDSRDAPIDIYILRNRSDFEHFLEFYYPELPLRRAFFLAQGDRSIVYTYLGEHLDEDIRHEATHALLHASVTDVPLWLDEGLAEYFEVGPNRGGLNSEHLERLQTDFARGWKPNLVRLEGLQDVRQMSAQDYSESWAWVHFLLRGSPSARSELLGYLEDLRSNRGARPLSERLELTGPNMAARLEAHLSKARDLPVATITPGRSVVVRGQSSPLDSSRRPTPKRSTVFSRFLGLFGIDPR